MEQKNRFTKIGNIRAFAIFLVVLGHSIILYSQSWDLFTTKNEVVFLDILKKVIDIPQMPLFFALSGYLFVRTHRKKRGFLYLLKNKARRLLIPYFGIGFFFLLPIRIAIGFSSYQDLEVKQVLWKFCNSSDVGHLWFLPALFVVFLLSELILMIAESIPGLKKRPEVFFVFSALCLYLEGYRIGFGYAPLLGAFNYLIWFSLGYLFHIWQPLLQRVYQVWWIKILLLGLCAILHGYCTVVDSARLAFSLAAKGLFVMNAFGMMPDKTCHVVQKVDCNSFGIYLFHSPLIYITYATIPDAPPVIVVLINLVVFGAVAYGLTEVVRKTRFRILIGE